MAQCYPYKPQVASRGLLGWSRKGKHLRLQIEGIGCGLLALWHLCFANGDISSLEPAVWCRSASIAKMGHTEACPEWLSSISDFWCWNSPPPVIRCRSCRFWPQVTPELKKVFRGIFHSARQKHEDPDKARHGPKIHGFRGGWWLPGRFLSWHSMRRPTNGRCGRKPTTKRLPGGCSRKKLVKKKVGLRNKDEESNYGTSEVSLAGLQHFCPCSS